MFTATLACHPASPCQFLFTLSVTVQFLETGELQFGYSLSGEIDRLLLPVGQDAVFTDNLWQHTCFEAFVARVGEPSYREFNFSPSLAWAAYAFSNYRQRSTWWPVQSPKLICEQTDTSLDLIVSLHPQDFLSPSTNQTLQIGLSAVLETFDGRLSYWALKHPGTQPDFHDRTAFNLTIPH